ncbi:hypothetical protein [Natronolimnohabitans innermongolicus]|uniref:Uncharacterized protein n=1 Tax=Natronolimnohabitans innermongolicus JCM 12255 TaxID=1227499 RepID=L9WTR5_9EURY|nr:hypothetical protein [Natronolimnohabitans innermongolicus]ELY52601.1 hypothetical protein C493_16170 [Natronolimnohabitans innermongolicus JCM 12255]
MGENVNHTFDGVGVWGGGFTGGLVGGIAMGLVLHAGDLIELLGGLAPVPGTAVGAGWAIHLFLSVLFGLVFAAIASSRLVGELASSFTDYVIVGLAFAAVLGLFAGGVLFPVAMERAGVAALPLPFLPMPGIAGELFSALLFALGHLVYGLVLGAVFAAINGITPHGAGEYAPLER